MAEAKEAEVERWDPFRDLMSSGFGSPSAGRLFDEFLGERARRGAIRPAVDVTEADDSYVITVEIPGVRKQDLTLECREGVLTVRGEKKSSREEEKERGRLLERSYGAFSRSLSLPADADLDKVAASFHDGVLRVEIRKVPEAKPKAIAIKG